MTNRMLAITCSQSAAGDIRARQPKSPGHAKQAYNRAVNFVPAEPQATFANAVTKDKTGETFRCCRCGADFQAKSGVPHNIRRV